MLIDVPAYLGFHCLSTFRFYSFLFVCYKFFKQELTICDYYCERDRCSVKYEVQTKFDCKR